MPPEPQALPNNTRWSGAQAAPGFVFRSGKTYTHAQGLSCCFRQWRASHSHCRFLHGYAIQVELTFASESLDERNWVQDFGGLKDVKWWLEQTFDHKTLVAVDDPGDLHFQRLEEAGLIEITWVPAVGCEAFARQIYDHVKGMLRTMKDAPALELVVVREHEGNWASYGRKI